jgi:hypothetical protein
MPSEYEYHGKWNKKIWKGGGGGGGGLGVSNMGCPGKQAFYFSKRTPSAGVKNKLGNMPYNSEQVFYVLYPRVSFHIDKIIFFSYNEFVLYFWNDFFFHNLL